MKCPSCQCAYGAAGDCGCPSAAPGWIALGVAGAFALMESGGGSANVCKECNDPIPQGLNVCPGCRCYSCGDSVYSCDCWVCDCGETVTEKEVAFDPDGTTPLCPSCYEKRFTRTISGKKVYTGGRNKAPGYNSWSWTTEDWRFIKPLKKPNVTFDKKCGAEGNRTPDGRVLLCLPHDVIVELRKTKEGREILWDQATKKAKAPSGTRVRYHPVIRELVRKQQASSPPDNPKLAKKK